MSTYLDEQLYVRRHKILSIIPASDLRGMYGRVIGDKRYQYPEELRSFVEKEWNKFEQEIKRWISVCWEGW